MSYPELLEMVLNGKANIGSELNSLREAPAEQQFERLLLIIRQQTKLDPFLANLDSLDPKIAPTIHLKAESYFVKGIVFYSRGQFKKGLEAFEIAHSTYPASHAERKLLSFYNMISGKLNIIENESGTSSLKYTEEDTMADLGELIAVSRQKELRHIEGLARRQRATQWEFSGQIKFAIEELDLAIALLEGNTPSSDLQIALLQQSWLCLVENNRERASLYLERSGAPKETRCEFPTALIDAILKSQNFSPSMVKKEFDTATPVWASRFEMWNSQKFYPVKQSIIPPKGGTVARLGNLEKLLCRSLKSGPKSKHDLIETLWPELAMHQTLDNRLHRLISRTNKKLEGKIEYDGLKYSMF